MDNQPLYSILLAGAGNALVIFLFALLASWGLTHLVRRYLIAKAQYDIPNERSSHKVPTPRGGGLATSVVVVAGLGIVWAICHAMLPDTPFEFHDFFHLYAPLIGAALILIGVSWADDRFDVPPALRLSVHVFAAAIGTLAMPEEATVFYDFLPLWLDRVIVVISWAWFMNLTNFMDGIDGLTASETIAIAGGAFAVFLISVLDMPENDMDEITRNMTLAMLLMGAGFGFLFLNWHPAKIFLGDVGSVPFGFFLGFLLIQLAQDGCLAAALILPLYYLTDSGLTLLKRALKGKKVWQAHREHFYQRAALALGRHDTVVKWVIKTNIILIGLALLSYSAPWAAFVLAVLVVSGLLSFMSKATIQP